MLELMQPMRVTKGSNQEMIAEAIEFFKTRPPDCTFVLFKGDGSLCPLVDWSDQHGIWCDIRYLRPIGNERIEVASFASYDEVILFYQFYTRSPDTKIGNICKLASFFEKEGTFVNCKRDVHAFILAQEDSCDSSENFLICGPKFKILAEEKISEIRFIDPAFNPKKVALER